MVPKSDIAVWSIMYCCIDLNGKLKLVAQKTVCISSILNY